MHHAHTPWIVVLVLKMDEWKEAHEGKIPDTFKLKEEFRSRYVVARGGVPVGEACIVVHGHCIAQYWLLGALRGWQSPRGHTIDCFSCLWGPLLSHILK